MMNNSFLNIYISKVPNTPIGEVLNKERNEEILNIKNEQAKKEKYFIWKLFEKALKELDIDINSLTFKKNKNGKLFTDGFYFTFSHSNGYLAIAISSNNVGVDIQTKTEIKPSLVKKILNEKEYQEYLNSDEKIDYLFTKWTQKEAIFKYKGDAYSFIPCSIDTLSFDKILFSKNVNDLFISVASELKITSFKEISLENA